MKTLILVMLLISASPIYASVPSSNSKGQYNHASLESILSAMKTSEPLPIIQKLTTSADNGDPSAQFMLAVIYDKGIHVKQDKERAGKLVQLSAEGGYPEAMFVVAEKFDHERNYPIAFGWYRKAAEAGQSESMHRLAEMYRDGRGTVQNLSLFFIWVKNAANARIAAAQYDLSLAYLKGDGCKQDFPRAYGWLKVAADYGHEKAIESLPKYKQNMPADEIAEGEKLYLEFSDKLLRDAKH